MTMSREKPPLTDEERREKQRLNQLFLKSKPKWKDSHGRALTQTLLGELVGEMVNGEAMTQGAVWQYLNEDHKTKLNAPIVQAIAAVCGFEPKDVSPRFEPKEWLLAGKSGPSGHFDSLVADLSEEDIVAAVTRWSETIEPKLAMKLAHALLLRAASEL